MAETKYCMQSLIKIFVVIFAAALAEGCSRERSFDLEPLATGGYIIRATASNWREAPGTARERVLQDTAEYCRISGREAKIKEIKIHSNSSGILETAEAEFDCPPLPSRATR